MGRHFNDSIHLALVDAQRGADCEKTLLTYEHLRRMHLPHTGPDTRLHSELSVHLCRWGVYTATIVPGLFLKYPCAIFFNSCCPGPSCSPGRIVLFMVRAQGLNSNQDLMVVVTLYCPLWLTSEAYSLIWERAARLVVSLPLLLWDGA